MLFRSRQSKRRELLAREYSRLRDVLGWADWNEQTAITFGEIKAQLEHSGQAMKDWDIAVAAVARTMSAPVVTKTPGQFDGIMGLKVVAW